MLWTSDKTDTVLRWGAVSAVLATVISAITNCCGWSLFFSLWALTAVGYIVSAALEVQITYCSTAIVIIRLSSAQALTICGKQNCILLTCMNKHYILNKNK